MTDDDRTLADLCRPLSARDMPRSRMWNAGGRALTPGTAIKAQRLTRRPGHRRTCKTKPERELD